MPQESVGLANYIKDVLYADWSQERKRTREPKWQRNIDAFNAVSRGFWKHKEAQGWRSKTFIQITRIKVVSAVSIIMDMLLQGGRIPLKLQLSPMEKVRLEDMDPDMRESIEDAMDDAEKLMHQQLADTNADKQLMWNVLAAAIYGETYAKWGIADVTRHGYKQVNLAPAGTPDAQDYLRYEPDKEVIETPTWIYRNVWDIFRDLETNDLQAGIGIIDRDFVSRYDLYRRMDEPLWINESLEKAIKKVPIPGAPRSEGDTGSMKPADRDIAKKRRGLMELEFWGRAPADLVNAWADGKEELLTQNDYEHNGNEIEIMLVLSGDEITRFDEIDEDERPFYRAVWEEKLDHNEGNGVADNLEDTQMVMNGAVRGFEDNIRLAGDVMGIMKEGAFKNDDRTFRPGYVLDTTDEIESVSDAWQQVIVEPVGQIYLEVINLFERFADEVSQLPKILQGEVSTQGKPETAFQSNQLQINAGKYLGGVIKNIDEGIIEPMGNAFQRYNMLMRQGPEGNFVAKATGFSSFQNTMMRLQKLMQYITLVLSDDRLAAEGKLRETLEEIVKAMDLSPDLHLKSAQEKQEAAEQEAAAAAEQENKVKELAAEQARMEEEAKQADHQRELDKQERKSRDDIIMASMKNRRAA